MSWIDKYRQETVQKNKWSVSSDGSRLYSGDGHCYKRIVLPSVAEQKAVIDLEELDAPTFQEVDASEASE